MKLTTKGKFAVAALLDMATYAINDQPMTLYAIGDRQRISVSYLEQIFVKLRKHGVVKSYKGPGGGYKLSKALDQIRISEIIRAVDDDMDATTCKGMANCNHHKKCLSHTLWDGLTHHVYAYLDGITLHNLVIGVTNPKLQQVKIIQHTVK